jgi:Zn-dependent peptidase ImmA (M78 family)
VTLRTKGVNPALLQWARQKAGLSVEEAGGAIGQSASAIAAWEAGEQAPTYRQLADLAYRVYKRPIATFFFPEPPGEVPISSEFRTLPDSELEKLEPDTLFAIRQARAWQLSIPEIVAGLEITQGSVSVLRVEPSETASHLAERVRDLLGVTLAVQRSWSSDDEALKEWRAAVENYGVFVFKRSFEQKSVSGFSLDDATYPVVTLSNSTSHTRQIFTLMHELAHICFGISGITTRDEGYVGSLAPSARSIEVNCNRFAAAILLPTNAVRWADLVDADDTVISNVARAFHVSREVVLRRLVDSGIVAPEDYGEYVARWYEDYLRPDAKSSGGSYYATQGTYLSRSFLTAAFNQYHKGRLSVGDLAEHLQMKAQNLAKFESYVMSHGVAE